MSERLPAVSRLVYAGLVGGVVAFIAVDIADDTKRLTSLGGLLAFLLLGFLTSTNPSKVYKNACFLPSNAFQM